MGDVGADTLLTNGWFLDNGLCAGTTSLASVPVFIPSVANFGDEAEVPASDPVLT